MISLLTPLLPVARILEVPVLDFDTYLKLQDSVQVAKDPWQRHILFFLGVGQENGPVGSYFHNLLYTVVRAHGCQYLMCTL